MADQSGWNPQQPGQPPQQPGYGQPPQQPNPYGQPPGGAYNQPGFNQPGPGDQGYNQGFGVAAPPKRRKWPWILGGIFLLFVVLIGGCSFLVFNLARGPIDGANEWMALVDEGNYSAAYESMCEQTKNATDFATAESQLEADFGAGVDDYNISSVESANGQTSVTGTVSVGGSSRTLEFGMRNENDAWRVCAYGPG